MRTPRAGAAPCASCPPSAHAFARILLRGAIFVHAAEPPRPALRAVLFLRLRQHAAAPGSPATCPGLERPIVSLARAYPREPYLSSNVKPSNRSAHPPRSYTAPRRPGALPSRTTSSSWPSPSRSAASTRSAKHVTRVKRTKRVKRAAAHEPARGPGLSHGGVTCGGGAAGEPELAAHPALVRARRARGVCLVGAVDARLPQLQVVALPSSLSECFVAPFCFLRRWLWVSMPFSSLQQRRDLGRQRDAARLRGRPGAGLRAGRANVLGAAEEREPPAPLSTG